MLNVLLSLAIAALGVGLVITNITLAHLRDSLEMTTRHLYNRMDALRKSYESRLNDAVKMVIETLDKQVDDLK